jgi:NAD(P)-dependent dehydrogenase (short-subunit alcohol dehydrogenase family)
MSMQKGSTKKKIRKPQHQARPGSEQQMHPQPIFDRPENKGSDKLKNKVALITGGDSGIGRAVAVLFAKEGADIAIAYLNEHKDAKETKRVIEEQYRRNCLLIPGDLANERHCISVIKKLEKEFKYLDILVNNAAVQFPTKSLEDISTQQLQRTFGVNIFSFFWITKAALPLMKAGSCIINSTSVTAYRGSPELLDYSSTKGAIVAFTRSLSANLVDKGIRVNAVAPGPIWTPLIPSTFEAEKTAKHGSDAPMKRAGEPVEIAPSYLFLACEDSSYITGQVLHPNGGEIING